MRNWAARTTEVPRAHGPPGTDHPPGAQLPGPGKGRKHTAHAGLCPHGAPKSLSSSGPGRVWNKGSTWARALAEHPGARAVWAWEGHAALGRLKPCDPSTASTPHTCWRYLSAGPPLHITTEQVSLKKGPPLPPRVRVEIRHFRDLETEDAKINKEGGMLWKWQVPQIKTLQLMLRLYIWGATIDFENKYRPE